MKRIIVSMLLMTAASLTTVFANDNPAVNDKIMESFKKEFAGAHSVKWGKSGDYQKATFGFLGHRVIAYFSQDGELIGSLRDILFDQLPMGVIRAFGKRFGTAEFINIHEISNTEGTSYWLTLETENKRYHVKTDGDGNILKVDKIKN